MKKEIKEAIYTILTILTVVTLSGLAGYGLHNDNVLYECVSNFTDMQVCNEEGTDCKTLEGDFITVSYVYGEKDIKQLEDVVVFTYYGSELSEIINSSGRVDTAENLDMELLKGCRKI